MPGGAQRRSDWKFAAMSIADTILRVSRPRLAVGSRFWCPALALTACLALGGGTRAGFLADVILQLLCIPLLLITIFRWSGYSPGEPGAAHARFALTILGGLIVLLIAQLVPLPPSVWSMLPGRGTIVEAMALAGVQQPWLPLSVAPDATWFALMSLIPTLAVFLGTLQIDLAGRRQLMVVVLAFVAGSAFLGMLQVAQGEGSRLRPFEYTNLTEAVGFFANRNHFAALMYAGAVPTIVMMGLAVERLASNAPGAAPDSSAIFSALISVSMVVMLFSAMLAARSRAGLILMMIALVAGSITIAALPKMRRTRRRGRWLATAGIGLVVLIAGQLALVRLLQRFTVDPTADSRIPFAWNTIEAAKAFMPFGSGIGTFVPVYGTVEKFTDAYSGFANRAHNDYLEIWLETGAAGFVLLAGFLVWLALRAKAVLERKQPNAQMGDVLLARAALAIVVLLLLHSFVDYPLRTAALSGLFAFACALLLPPPVGIAAESARLEQQRRASQSAVPYTKPSRPLTSMLPAQTGEQAPWQADPRWTAPTAGSAPVVDPTPQASPPPLPKDPATNPAQSPPGPAAGADWEARVAAASATEAGEQSAAPPSPAPARNWSDEASWPDAWRKQPPKAKPPERKE